MIITTYCILGSYVLQSSPNICNCLRISICPYVCVFFIICSTHLQRYLIYKCYAVLFVLSFYCIKTNVIPYEIKNQPTIG